MSDSVVVFWHGLAWHVMEGNGSRGTEVVITRQLLPPRHFAPGLTSPRLSPRPALHCTCCTWQAGRQAGKQAGSRSAMRRWSKSYSTRQWQNARPGSWILRARVAERMTRKGVHWVAILRSTPSLGDRVGWSLGQRKKKRADRNGGH